MPLLPLVVLPFLLGPAALALPSPSPAQCARVAFGAERASCSGSLCTLDGRAHLACGALRLSADHLMIAIDPANGRFAGASADGQVTLVQGEQLITCRHLTLDGDAIQARLDAATLALYALGAPQDGEGRPTGRRQAVLHGDLERPSAQRLRLTGGDFTLCDCGPRQRPSWRFDASLIEVHVGQRATIWRPQLYANLLGLGMVPLTPPLLPISVPLRGRALGLLAPRLRLYGGLTEPTLDLPLFVPLGDSYDLTVQAGIRSDWGAAPRLGLRLRYAPSQNTAGSLRAQLTYDAAGAGAVQAAGLPSNPAHARILAATRPLRSRVDIGWRHASELSPGVDAQVEARWVSDMLVPSTFPLALRDIYPPQYLPSSTQLLVRRPRLAFVGGADLYLRLLPAIGLLGRPGIPTHLSNLGGRQNAQQGVLQRLPHAHLQLLPWPLGGGFYLEAAVHGSRARTLLSGQPYAQDDLIDGVADPSYRAVRQELLGAILGLGGGFARGPLRLRAAAQVDALLVHAPAIATYGDVLLRTDAELSLRAQRRLGGLVHLLAPRLTYRGLPQRWVPEGLKSRFARQDPRLLRRPTQQLQAVFSQSFYPAVGGGDARARLELGQALDLHRQQLLQPWLALAASGPYGGITLWTSLDYSRLHSQLLRGLETSLYGQVGPLSTSLQYSRLAPDADRFRRGMYELSAPRQNRPQPEAKEIWQHLLRATISLGSATGFRVTSTTGYLLPSPNPALPTCVGGGRGGCFAEQSLVVTYTSSCNCWGLGTNFSVFPQQKQPGMSWLDGRQKGLLTASVYFQILDMRLGNRGIQ